LEARLLPIPAVQLVVRTIRGLGAHDASHMAAGVAYYAILSLFPLLLGMIAILGVFLPSESLQEDIFDFFRRNMPGLVDVLQDNIENVIRYRGAIGAVSIVLLLWSGSAMFGAISKAINRAFGIHKDRSFFVSKALNMGMALGVGLLFLLTLGASSVFTILGAADVTKGSIAADLGARLLGFLLNLPVFLLVYKFLPNTKTSWRYVWPGAILAAVLFEIAKTVFIFYLSHFANYESVYGSVGSIIVLLVWIYFSAFILIVGAEFSSQYGLMRGVPVKKVPSPGREG